jgi:PemK-like, MazF-like toxin of type II toxin-antitoxin system
VALPTPELGLVLNYAYLWHDEHLAGKEEGRKNRPSVIVLCSKREEDQSVVVTVLPITHSAPKKSTSAIEIPQAIKHHLGLDDARSWIMLTEGNDFIWPGYDLRKVPSANDYAFGFLPPRFFRQIQYALAAYLKTAKLKSTKRG